MASWCSLECFINIGPSRSSQLMVQFCYVFLGVLALFSPPPVQFSFSGSFAHHVLPPKEREILRLEGNIVYIENGPRQHQNRFLSKVPHSVVKRRFSISRNARVVCITRNAPCMSLGAEKSQKFLFVSKDSL